LIAWLIACVFNASAMSFDFVLTKMVPRGCESSGICVEARCTKNTGAAGVWYAAPPEAVALAALIA
jgi:hypothetical protein